MGGCCAAVYRSSTRPPAYRLERSGGSRRKIDGRVNMDGKITIDLRDTPRFFFYNMTDDGHRLEITIIIIITTRPGPGDNAVPSQQANVSGCIT